MRWNAFGIAGILSIALLNTSCCSHRKAVSESRSEATEQMSTTLQSESRSEEQHAATLTVERLDTQLTETEIEVYESEPDTQSPPRLKARIRQRHGEKEQSWTDATSTGREATETVTQDSTTYKVGTLDEVTVTPTKSPGLWERLKQGAAWATAIMILTAAGYIIYKLKKRKTT